MGALRAPLPACALVKSRGRRDQPSNLPGAGAPPRCSARGGAHQGNAARKALAMLLNPTRPWLSNEGGPGHTHVPVSHDPAGKKWKMQGISRTRPHSPPGGEGGRYLGKVCLQTKAASSVSPAPSFPGAGPLLPRSGTRGFILAPIHHRGPKKVPQPETPCAIRLWCQLRLKWPCPDKGLCHPSSRRRGASCPPTPSLLRGDPGELGPCRLMRTRLQGQDWGRSPSPPPTPRDVGKRKPPAEDERRRSAPDAARGCPVCSLSS